MPLPITREVVAGGFGAPETQTCYLQIQSLFILSYSNTNPLENGLNHYYSPHTFPICPNPVIIVGEYTRYSNYRKAIDNGKHTDTILSSGKILYRKNDIEGGAFSGMPLTGARYFGKIFSLILLISGFITTFVSKRVTHIEIHSKALKQKRLPIRYLYFS